MTNKNSFSHFICLKCKANNSLEEKETQISCSKCGASYPYLRGETPVLVENAPNLMAAAYREYAIYVQQKRALVNRLNHTRHSSKYRNSETKKLLAEAIETNTNIIDELRKELETYVFPGDLINQQDNAELHYLTNLDYIRRDWSGEALTEMEIEQIRNRLLQLIGKHQVKKNNALFLGAGTGRIAWEMQENFEQTFAPDKSISMIALLNKIRKEPLELYEINYTNVLHKEGLANKYQATIKNSKQRATTSFIPFVGDALNMPFEEGSISTIFSVYFTDVLPLKQLMPEIKRLLTPNGYYFHFGPLQYHFSDIEEMLCGEEIRTAFEEEGFEWLEEDALQLSHHSSSSSFNQKQYNNWIFAVRKKQEANREVNLTTVLSIDKGFRYTVNGTLGTGDEATAELQYSILLPDGQALSASELILEMCRRTDGTKSIQHIIQGIEEEYQFTIEEPEEVVNIMKQLLNARVMKM